MRLVIERPAIRRLNEMPKAIRESIRRRLDEISADPFAKHPNVRRYKEGGPNTYRLRQGQWRAIYEIDRGAQVVRLLVVDTRGGVYR